MIFLLTRVFFLLLLLLVRIYRVDFFHFINCVGLVAPGKEEKIFSRNLNLFFRISSFPLFVFPFFLNRINLNVFHKRTKETGKERKGESIKFQTNNRCQF